MSSQDHVATSRPVPLFDNTDEGIFSTKKARAQTERKYRPPPPPHPARIRSTLSRSRVRSCLPETRALAVSFKDDSDSSVLTNSLYNTSHQLSFLDQCFEDKQPIGTGCFGEVFSARSKLDGKMYAIKKSRQRFRSNADRRRRLEEVRKHERLPPHRHCVSFHGAWEEQEHLYLQTELCATSLADVADANHSIPEATVWAYMVDLLLAVKHLHDNQLVHLDIKPENIFVFREGYCKLGDFGLVMDVSGNCDLNDSDVTEGDPKYMAPELMRGVFSPAADIFSLGLTLLELACDLELPRGAAGWHRLRQGQLPAPLRDALSPPLWDVLERMLQPEPERRPSAGELLRLPAVRAARRRVSVVRGVLARLYMTLLSALVFLLWLVCWPVRCMTDASASAGAMSPLQPPAPADGRGEPPGWFDPAISDVDDDSLDVSVDELHHLPAAVRNSTPKMASARPTLRSRHQDSLRRELAFGAAQPIPVEEEGDDSSWAPPSRRLEESFNSCATVRLDFKGAEFSDDD
ncbi:membrane-associated tyrosine- and threonine-specific cdc2-inhibitory kinase-like [Pollicipes pollicipes]|uniref:membrane-associated tyrosine- and threonine-specific cdc2-inhibitory kinase-like n=1 Tax=Pollicipes pollicipes TaxID=41117 RepID=UPI001884E2BC|nr:membrane-associated tyrosine- and threonine-specific cdc2-inhibitory kinase-like [Pollicipes pollicipes]